MLYVTAIHKTVKTHDFLRFAHRVRRNIEHVRFSKPPFDFKRMSPRRIVKHR